ncbi:MAG: hypothetical protein KatS3mg131_3294 [Candidatus Tectimicrobiota bacterium]|nr:MAG: hypothetical protein KatS3mg131_3294 [Candidatus Tectomicrobia bacterium]
MCDRRSCGRPAGCQPAISVPATQRRAFLRGLIALPLAAVLASPRLARAAAARLQKVTLQTASGATVHAFLATPQQVPAPAVVLIHEWWGLNDQIKAVAAEFAQHGFLALAVDLFGGNVATTPEAARAQVAALDAGRATETLVGWIAWLRQHPSSTGKIGTVGWCFGGGWSLNVSLATPVDGTVIYYGDVRKTPEQLQRLRGPVLGHFATRDHWITADMVRAFTQAMAAAGKPVTVYWYDAEHAFANPTGARYDAQDAQLAWSRTLAFFRQHLGG